MRRFISLFLVLLFVVLCSGKALAAYSGWKYNTGDLDGSTCLQERCDDLDDRLDSIGITSATSDLTPPSDGAYDLGSSILEWQDLWLDGIASMDCVSNSAPINVENDWNPGQDGAWDLGSSAKEWQDIHIDGIANVDTISNSVAINVAQTFDLGDSFSVTNAHAVDAAVYSVAGVTGLNATVTGATNITATIAGGLITAITVLP